MLTKAPAERAIPTSSRLPDPERSEREAVRRAQAMIRRLVAEHELTRMVTLTNADATTAPQRREVVHRVQLFVKRIRRRVPFARWLAVLEWHPGGHGWHVHLVTDRFVPKHLLQEAWTWGFVDARLIRPKGEGTSRQAARKAGQYVAKYLGKGVGEHEAPAHERGDQRYLRAEGMHVTELLAEGSYEALLAASWSHVGGSVGWMWWSGAEPTWRGPRVLVIRSG